jgi:hypothetical protein
VITAKNIIESKENNKKLEASIRRKKRIGQSLAKSKRFVKEYNEDQ